MKLRNLTNAQKEKLIENEENWPRCKWCNKKINPERYKRQKGKSGAYYMHYFEWLNAKYCCRECGYKAVAKFQRKPAEEFKPKYCSVCRKRFYKTDDISATRWLSIRNCPEHRHQQKVRRTAMQGFEDTTGQAVTQGFYVFAMPEHEKLKRRNEMVCLQFTGPEQRDEIIDRVCQEMQE